GPGARRDRGARPARRCGPTWPPPRWEEARRWARRSTSSSIDRRSAAKVEGDREVVVDDRSVDRGDVDGAALGARLEPYGPPDLGLDGVARIAVDLAVGGIDDVVGGATEDLAGPGVD